MKSGLSTKESLLEIREKALIARHNIDDVIASVDKFINTYSTNDMISMMREQGASYQKIADNLGLSYSAVAKRAKKLELYNITKE